MFLVRGSPKYINTVPSTWVEVDTVLLRKKVSNVQDDVETLNEELAAYSAGVLVGVVVVLGAHGEGAHGLAVGVPGEALRLRDAALVHPVQDLGDDTTCR